MIDSFCILPWVHLHIDPQGDVWPCCVMDKTGATPFGNVQKSPIIEIINSDVAKKMRTDMLSGNTIKHCEVCDKNEKNKIYSYRQSVNNDRAISKDPARDTATALTPIGNDGHIDNYQPTYLDIRINNICNLKCRICSGYYSSAIDQESKTRLGDKAESYTTLTSNEKDATLREVKKYLGTVTKIYFAGGEPLIMPEHYEILDELVKIGRTKEVTLYYSTNFTRLSYKSKNVLDYWKKFGQGRVVVSASLDAKGSSAEYLRHGTIWKDIENNLKQLQKECPHVEFNIMSTVTNLGIESLIELQQDFIVNFNLGPKTFHLQPIYHPKYLSPSSLPVRQKIRIAEKINKHIEWLLNIADSEKLVLSWKNVIDMMQVEIESDVGVVNFTKDLDNYRGEQLKTVFPQFQDLG